MSGQEIKLVLKRDVTIHSLKAFNRILLESGVDLGYIQELLGHKHSKTTKIYTNVSTRNLSKIKGPLDLMEGKKYSE